MMKNQIIEHIKNQQYVQIENLLKTYCITYPKLHMIITQFNQSSFYCEITIVDKFDKSGKPDAVMAKHGLDRELLKKEIIKVYNRK